MTKRRLSTADINSLLHKLLRGSISLAKIYLWNCSSALRCESFSSGLAPTMRETRPQIKSNKIAYGTELKGGLHQCWLTYLSVKNDVIF